MDGEIESNFSGNKIYPTVIKSRLTEKQHLESNDIVISSEESSDEFQEFGGGWEGSSSKVFWDKLYLIDLKKSSQASSQKYYLMKCA